MPDPERTILHLDMDAFYAAVEQLDHPDWRGRPVVVGAPPDRRGVVCTASYEARKFGIHSAMPSCTAGKLCPQAIFAPVRMARYEEVSRQVMVILGAFSPVVEQVSIDEAFLDVSGVLSRWPDAVAIAREMKRRIRAETGLTASVGVAGNKFLAKLASDLHKPDGLTVVPRDAAELQAFLRPLPVGRIWGVGKVTAAQFARLGIHTIGQVQERREDDLARLLGGAMARHVWRLARGLDDRPLETESEEKSISNETTYDEDCANGDVQRQTLLELAEEVGRRLRDAGRRAGTAHIKIRFGDFRTITRQAPLRPPTDSDRELIRRALELFERERVAQPVRLLGFGVSNLGDPAEAAPQQLWLLPEGAGDAAADAATPQLDGVVDDIRRRFGTRSLKRGNWRGG